MSHLHLQAAVARERQNMMLAEAQAARQAREARSRRRGPSRPARRWPASWLSAWRRLFAPRLGSGPAPAGARVAPHGDATVAEGALRRAAAPAAADHAELESPVPAGARA